MIRLKILLSLMSIIILQSVLVTIVAEVVHHVLFKLLLSSHREHCLTHGTQLAAAGALRRRDAHQHSVLLRDQRARALFTGLEAGHGA